jgi:hypothetical protein
MPKNKRIKVPKHKISPFWFTVRETVDSDRQMTQMEILKQARRMHASFCSVR